MEEVNEVLFEIMVNSKITLKLRNQSHVEEMYVLTMKNMQRLKPWLFWANDAMTIEETEVFIRRNQEYFKSEKSLDLGIFYEGRLIGSGGLHGIEKRDKKAAIGYWVDEEYEGMGIVTKSIAKVIEYAFHDLGLNRLELLCGEKNIGSKAVAERLSFTLEGVLREYHIINGVTINDLVFSLLKSDYQNQKVK